MSWVMETYTWVFGGIGRDDNFRAWRFTAGAFIWLQASHEPSEKSVTISHQEIQINKEWNWLHLSFILKTSPNVYTLISMLISV